MVHDLPIIFCCLKFSLFNPINFDSRTWYVWITLIEESALLSMWLTSCGFQYLIFLRCPSFWTSMVKLCCQLQNYCNRCFIHLLAFLEPVKDFFPCIIFRFNEVLCLGDININLFSFSVHALRYGSVSHGLGLTQAVSTLIRVWGWSGSSKVLWPLLVSCCS